MAAATIEEGPKRRSEWSRRYPPLISILVALLIALLVLPSALNIPQSNPTQTQEYAPVPPSDKNPPAKGNTTALGLGNDATISESNVPPPPPPGQKLLPPALANAPLPGKTPRTKACVKDGARGVLRQTDDPLSPPCVADFQGDNFGATYQGVDRQEIRILVYLQGGFSLVNLCDTANEQTPPGTYYDLAVPPTQTETCQITGLSIFQKYFNDRYQTYNRFVHFYAYYSENASAPEGRRADAAANYSAIKPFAVISFAGTFESDYLQAMAQYHVLNFGSFSGRDNAFFQAFPKLIWGYAPSTEEQSANYASFICQKMAGKPTSFSDAAHNGKPRKYGLMYTTDPAHPELREFKDDVKAILDQCGVKISAEATFPLSDYTVAASNSTATYPQTNMARFQADGITTIIWAGGIETSQSGAAQQLNYFPEWLLAGDGSYADGYGTNTYQNGSEWAHAWVVTYQPYEPGLTQTVCYQAYKSVDPTTATDSDIQSSCAYYDQLRQLFTGIQVAGNPRLGPTSIDAGFHAIPPQVSFDPRVPACYYDTGDYTCIKDGVAMWWDQNGTVPGGSRATGCYRGGDDGRRFLTNQWPPGDVLTMKQKSNACSAFGGTYQQVL